MDIAPVADANGWYTHWIAILRATPRESTSEERLREPRAQTAAASRPPGGDPRRASPPMFALLDLDGCILSVSRSWHDFAVASGIDVPAPVGRSYLEFGASNCWAELGPAITEGLGAVLAGRLPHSASTIPATRAAGAAGNPLHGGAASSSAARRARS